MKKVYTALLLILLAAMFSVGVYSLADYDATGSVSEKREFVKPEFSVKSLLDGTYIPALEQYYSDTFPGRESLLQANRTLNKFYYYSGSGGDSVLILNQTDSAAQGGESLDAVQRANGQTPQPEQTEPAAPDTTPEPQPDTTPEPADSTQPPEPPEVTFQQIFRFRQFFSEGKKVLGGTEIFHQLASFGRVPLPDRIQPLFKFGLVDLPQRKGRVQPPL